MIVEYTFHTELPADKNLYANKTYNITDVASIYGSMLIRTKEKDIVSEPTPVLIDLTQIINSMTMSSIDKHDGTTIPVLLDLEPRLYITYGEHLSFYEYPPSEISALPNPLLEQLSRDEAADVAEQLRQRVTDQLMSLNSRMLHFYKALLLL
jgi:hypothetical protein